MNQFAGHLVLTVVGSGLGQRMALNRAIISKQNASLTSHPFTFHGRCLSPSAHPILNEHVHAQSRVFSEPRINHIHCRSISGGALFHSNRSLIFRFTRGLAEVGLVISATLAIQLAENSQFLQALNGVTNCNGPCMSWTVTIPSASVACPFCTELPQNQASNL